MRYILYLPSTEDRYKIVDIIKAHENPPSREKIERRWAEAEARGEVYALDITEHQDGNMSMQQDEHCYLPHPELSVYKERGAVDGKKEILPYRKNKGYTLLTFRTAEDACYFNSGIAFLKGIRFQIREWTKKYGIGAEIVIVPKEVFYGQADGGA